MKITGQIIGRNNEEAPMKKNLLKNLVLTMAFNFLIAFCGSENCSAQTITGTCTDQYGGGCFTQFTNEPLPYTTNSFTSDNCGGGTSTSTITVSGSNNVQFSWTGSTEDNPVNVSLDESQQSNPFPITPGQHTLTWGTIWCNPITFAFKPINQATATKKNEASPQPKQQ